MTSSVELLGERIRRFRDDLGLSLSELAQRAEISKGYLSALENEQPKANRRPSANTLIALSNALGVTFEDLLGEAIEAIPRSGKLPKGLVEFAKRDALPDADVEMLARIEFRGQQPKSADGWKFIYDAIRLSAGR
jgi:transcriptional regulator with XRE-family HTH domain